MPNNIPMGLEYYLPSIDIKINDLSSLQIKHIANCTIENLSTCLEDFKGTEAVCTRKNGDKVKMANMIEYIEGMCNVLFIKYIGETPSFPVIPPKLIKIFY
jgi:hypothetical protein